MEETPIPNDGLTKSVKTTNVPVADLDFATVVGKVSTKWNASPWLTLQWTNVSEFETKTTTYQATLTTRIQTGNNRPQITKALQNINKEIDNKLANVKGYIADKYGKENAVSYYVSFGIEFSNKTYRFPIDQNNRSEALALMVNSISANGFDDKTYGKDYWLDIQSQFNELLVSASNTDSTVSNKVGDKNTLKKELKRALNSIVLVIKGNYPDTYKQELRTWGFQKEKY